MPAFVPCWRAVSRSVFRSWASLGALSGLGCWVAQASGSNFWLNHPLGVEVRVQVDRREIDFLLCGQGNDQKQCELCHWSFGRLVDKAS